MRKGTKPRQTVIGETVCRYLEKYPDHPSKTIARLLCDEEPELFPNVEQARTSVRAYRGNLGQKTRAKNMGGRKHYRPSGKQSDQYPVALPEPLEDGVPWRVVQVDCKLALILSDVHIPFHDRAALELALAYGKDRSVDCVILNGDLMDFYACSSFQTDPRLRCLADEIQVGRRFLECLRETFPKARLIFKEGNHEERLWRYVWSRAPELVGVKDGEGREAISLASLLDLQEYGVELVADKQPLLAGEHLHILHGHEYRSPFTNPVNPARGLYLKAKCNALCGHLHQTSNHSEKGLTHVVSCWSTGCLCDLRPRYMPLNKWNLGFATVEVSDGSWSVENKKIIDGRIV